jgi:hypothetical protein
MCPFCLLQAATIVSGSIFAGGLGTYLLRKSRAWGRPRETELQADASEVNKPYSAIGTTEEGVHDGELTCVREQVT